MSKAGRIPLLVAGISLALGATLACARGVLPNLPVGFASANAVTSGTTIGRDSAQYAQATTTSAYDSIAVVQPANDATVFDNTGKVDVIVAIAPELRTGMGDRIALILDGHRTSVQGATRFKLAQIARGAHTLEAQVIDSTDTTVASSDPVKFNLWQASRLFPARRGR